MNMHSKDRRGRRRANGRSYASVLSPPVVVICVDGSEPGYIEAAIAPRA
jgi:hypothetical protein